MPVATTGDAPCYNPWLFAPQVFSNSNDGVALLGGVLNDVVPALVALVNQPPEDGISIKVGDRPRQVKK